MTSTEPNPTDVLAQKRAEAAQAEQRSAGLRYWIGQLETYEGRAAVFALLENAQLWADAPKGSEANVWVWVGHRLWAARLLQEAREIAPLAIGSMWAEAMTREFEKRIEKTTP